MKYKIMRIETGNADFEIIDDAGNYMIKILEYVSGRGHEATMSKENWETLLEEIPKALEILNKRKLEI